MYLQVSSEGRMRSGDDALGVNHFAFAKNNRRQGMVDQDDRTSFECTRLVTDGKSQGMPSSDDVGTNLIDPLRSQQLSTSSTFN